MRKLKQAMQTAVLYMTAVVLVGGVPMASFADQSDACIAAGNTDDQWVTDPNTGQCVTEKTPEPTPSPSPSPVSSPAATPEATTTPSPAPTESVAPTSKTESTVPEGEETNGDTANANTNVTTDTTVNNNNEVSSDVEATTVSGNALVSGNKSAGSSKSGNSTTEATVVNSVHSTVDGNTGVAHFEADINGDVVGDITLGPTIEGANSSNSSTNLSGDTTVNNDTKLENDVKLTSVSGDATVRGNESTGSATTGDANAVANIMNLINTIIAANQSFVGTINIYGNLNGDILISPDFIPQLIASNANAVTTINMPLATNINDDQSIINNINLSAASGSAVVSGNETSGSATTGSSQTNLTILNLTGHTVNAENSVLVFVNVLGTWVGMIVDAPGATAAALGSGMTTNTTNISGQANLNNNASITNNLDLAALTGNAKVAGNETSGSAQSGNATASANIANISTSTFNLTGWFGILFINVFGTWTGSFGVDTEAGKVVPLTGMAVPPAAPGSPNVRFGFEPHSTASASSSGNSFSTLALSGMTGGGTGGGITEESGVVQAAKEFASAMQTGSAIDQPVLQPLASPREDPFSVFLMATGFSVAGLSGIVWAIRRWM